MFLSHTRSPSHTDSLSASLAHTLSLTHTPSHTHSLTEPAASHAMGARVEGDADRAWVDSWLGLFLGTGGAVDRGRGAEGRTTGTSPTASSPNPRYLALTLSLSLSLSRSHTHTLSLSLSRTHALSPSPRQSPCGSPPWMNPCERAANWWNAVFWVVGLMVKLMVNILGWGFRATVSLLQQRLMCERNTDRSSLITPQGSE